MPSRAAVSSALVVSCAAFAAFAITTAAQSPATTYFPDRFDWQRRAPAEAGIDAAALADAITFAVAQRKSGPRIRSSRTPRRLRATEPFDALIGPVKERGALNGLVIRRGYVVADWGETTRVDMTHSVTKTFLSTVVGLAWQKGLISERRRSRAATTCRRSTGAELFDAPHNQPITWDHLLRQTSDWQGTLWGKPDWADRPEGTPSGWANRPLYEPGTRYKYNDVRVNVLALAALHVFRRPLPDVLREEVMEPIGASSTWRWHGYENSWIELDGQRMQSVSGGGHWGGGMFIDAWDMARFGYLFLRERQVEGPADRLGEVDRDGAHARPGQRRIRLHELVS